jgi:hypothetical protein
MINKTLTKAEEEVIRLLSEEFLTPNKIAIRRGCSKQAVSKIISNLKKKGAINAVYNKVDKTQSTCKPFKKNMIRLHGQEFNIRILYKDQKYKKLKKKSNIIFIDGNTIRLYANSIEVYSGQSFMADDVDKATAKSFKYWNKLFARLEHDLKVILVKPRSQNIKLVNNHYSEINNGLAKDLNIKAEKIRIYGEDDGKLWFLIDNSFNLHEAETVHSEHAQEDMRGTIRPFFNELRKSKGYTPQFVLHALNELIKDREYYAKNLKSHVAAIRDLGKGIKMLKKDVNNLTKRLNQKKLNEWL